MGGITRTALAALAARERQSFLATRPRSVALAKQAAAHFPSGVPMHWMRDWPAPVPLYVSEARDAVLTDIDGHRYVDFCLGDTGAMFGHSPPAVARAIAAQAQSGLTTMLPDRRVPEVGVALAGFFGLPWWQLAQTATDANRAALRLARMLTGRPRILVFDRCYHGTVDETLVEMDADGSTLPRPGQVGRIHDPEATTVVVEFNDAAAVEAALARGDIACVLTEPVLTNAGMVLPQPGFLEQLRESCIKHGALLIIDETHTLSSGLGGYARQHGIAADLLVCGKAIAGGFPCAVYGWSAAVASRIHAADARRESGHSGIGTTLAANPLAIAALHAALGEVATAASYRRMEQGAARLAAEIEAAVQKHHIAWQVSRVGARLEFGAAPAPQTGRQSVLAVDHDLNCALHLYLLNRGFLLTPFHNMMLVSPVTTDTQIDAFIAACGDAFGEFAPLMRAA
jgi:glutamate-1-semialdehyde 2,1-aminomutase